MYTLLGSFTINELENINFDLARIAKQYGEQFTSNSDYWVNLSINDICKVVLNVDNGIECSTDIHISKENLDALMKYFTVERN